MQAIKFPYCSNILKFLRFLFISCRLEDCHSVHYLRYSWRHSCLILRGNKLHIFFFFSKGFSWPQSKCIFPKLIETCFDIYTKKLEVFWIYCFESFSEDFQFSRKILIRISFLNYPVCSIAKSTHFFDILLHSDFSVANLWGAISTVKLLVIFHLSQLNILQIGLFLFAFDYFPNLFFSSLLFSNSKALFVLYSTPNCAFTSLTLTHRKTLRANHIFTALD